MPLRPRDSETSSESGSPRVKRAWRSPGAIGLFLLVAVLSAGTDLWTKDRAFRRLEDPALADRVQDIFGTTQPSGTTPQTTRQVLQHLHLTKRICFGLSLTLSTNPGIVFGIDWFPLRAVNGLTVLMMAFVTVLFLYSESRHLWLHAALALLVGGAAGNLYDRLASSVVLPYLPPLRCHVRDFIDCSDLGYRWIFNLADAWLVLGVGMIFLHWMRTGRQKGHAPDPATTKKPR